MRSHGPELSCKVEQPGLLYRLFAWGIVSVSQREYKAQEGTNAEQPSLFCFCGAFTVTAANEAKKWYRRPKVRKFADRPFREKLSFLQRVFDGKEIKDYEKERKDFSEDFEIYDLAEGAVWGIKDLSLL